MQINKKPVLGIVRKQAFLMCSLLYSIKRLAIRRKRPTRGIALKYLPSPILK